VNVGGHGYYNPADSGADQEVEIEAPVGTGGDVDFEYAYHPERGAVPAKVDVLGAARDLYFVEETFTEKSSESWDAGGGEAWRWSCDKEWEGEMVEPYGAPEWNFTFLGGGVYLSCEEVVEGSQASQFEMRMQDVNSHFLNLDPSYPYAGVPFTDTMTMEIDLNDLDGSPGGYQTGMGIRVAWGDESGDDLVSDTIFAFHEEFDTPSLGIHGIFHLNRLRGCYLLSDYAPSNARFINEIRIVGELYSGYY
jgi:hypothetical protein